MAHPTCAHARLPNTPPAAERPPPTTDAERDRITERVKAELHAANEAGLALGCLRKLIVHTQGLRRDERNFTHYEVECLIALVSDEFERHLQVTEATAALLTPLYAARLHRATT